MNINSFISIIILTFIVFTPGLASSFFESERTGGMSEVYIADSSVRVTGGFILKHEKNDVTVRGKGLEISLNIDNSASDEEKTFNVVVENVNADITEIVGWAGDDIVRTGNSLKFKVKVGGRKVTVLKLSPRLPDESFKFIVFGESRGGDHVFKRIIGDINYRKPLFAISCGDMVEESSRGGYDDLLEGMKGVNVPFLTVAGSSELEGGALTEYEDAFGPSYYSFDYRNSHFIILNNGEGRMSEAQFMWLENDLMLNKALNTFVFMHLPAFDPRPARKQPMSAGGQHQRLTRLFEKNNVSMVFSSGIHSYFRNEKGGVTYTVTGGGGSELASGDAYHNYVIVEVAGNKAKDKVVKLVSPPQPWSEALLFKAKTYVKNSFQTKPVRTVVYGIILALAIFFIFRGIYAKLFSGTKKRKFSF